MDSADPPDPLAQEPREPTPLEEFSSDTVIPPENQTGGLASAQEPPPHELIYKSIWPPLIMAFFTGILTGSLLLLSPLRTSLSIPVENNSAPTPKTTPSPTSPTTQVIWDRGLQHGADTLSLTLALNRLQLAKRNILWVTTTPLQPELLDLLNAKRQEMPVVITVGANTPNAWVQPAIERGLAVLRSTRELEEPTNVFLIDTGYVIDISRQRSAWESTDPHIASLTFDWITSLQDNATAP